MEKERCRMEQRLIKVNPKNIIPFSSMMFSMSEIVDFELFTENIIKYRIPQLEVAILDGKLYSLLPSPILMTYQEMGEESMIVRAFEVQSEIELEKMFLILNFQYLEGDFLSIFDCIKKIGEINLPFKNEYLLRMKKIESLSFFTMREDGSDVF